MAPAAGKSIRAGATVSEGTARACSHSGKRRLANQSVYVDIADRRQFPGQLPNEDAHWKRIAQLSKES